MTTFSRIALVAVFGLTLGGCTSGNSAPTCSFNDPARMPPTPGATPGSGSSWPKFRANVQNTGTVTNITVSMDAQIVKRFPATGNPTGAFVASPVLNNGESALYIGSTDNTMYKLSTDPTQDSTFLTQDTTFNLVAAQPITSTALVAVRDGQDAIFVGGADGRLYGVTNTGDTQANYWPFATGAYVSASPTIALTDGTLYVGAENGLFNAVCPNGIVRFGGTAQSIESSAAQDASSNIYVGADDRQLRAFEYTGPLKWAFSASAPIVTAPVVEENGSSTFVYTVDLGGRAFKVNASNGQPVISFAFPSAMAPAAGPIASSPAMANGRLYFGSNDGNLYAISTDDGSLQWTVHTGGPIVSSPAVAIGPTQTIVVVGSMDGNLYIVDDADPAAPTVVPLRISADDPIEPIESSPAIGSDGTIYVGTDGNVKHGGGVYALR